VQKVWLVLLIPTSAHVGQELSGRVGSPYIRICMYMCSPVRKWEIVRLTHFMPLLWKVSW